MARMGNTTISPGGISWSNRKSRFVPFGEISFLLVLTPVLGLYALTNGVAKEPVRGAPAASTNSSTPGHLADYDRLITAEDREHWAFVPVRRPAVPAVRAREWVKNPLDAFILANLEEKRWRPNSPAPAAAWLRRVYLSLLGIPPTRAEQEAFSRDGSPWARAKLVDRLLARPEYGERWARHWLDLVRYAETNGYERDAIKPHVWRYRDYVIQSWNQDKPYPRFLLEQLAGDELPDADTQTLIATGYARLGPWDDEPADPLEDRFDQLDDMVSTTGSVFLGLTVGCARCHNHKFEPITQVDYYRLVAVFQPLDRPRNGRMELDLPAAGRTAVARQNERDARLHDWEQENYRLRAQWRQEFLSRSPRGFTDEVLAALRKPADQRDSTQKTLVERHQAAFEQAMAEAMPAPLKQTLVQLQKQVSELKKQQPDLPRGYFSHERTPPPVTHLLKRGKATQPDFIVPPGLPTVLTSTQPDFLSPDQHSSRRRLSLAHWLASDQHPLTARLIVNRVWQWHFGKGIVPSPNDFGKMGYPPTHPELLDWLAHWFVHDAGWSVKRLHQLILSSNTYAMSNRIQPQYQAEDPENNLYWTFPYRRVQAEVLRDSALAVSGQLNRQMYGPSMYPEVPRQALEGHSDPDLIWKPFDERAAARRSIYAFIKRSLIVPLLEVLDFADTTRSCPERLTTCVSPQALMLFNGSFVNRQAAHFARRLENEAGDDTRNRLRLAYQLALCRLPNEAEMTFLAQFEKNEISRWLQEQNSNLIATNKPSEPGTTIAKDTNATQARRHAWQQICRVIFNLNEFVYPD